MAVHIIGISGKKQHGKNTVAYLIQFLLASKKFPNLQLGDTLFYYPGVTGDVDTDVEAESGWKQKSFAQKLKQIGALLLNVDPKKFEDEEYKNSELWVNPESGESITPRLILQKIGTELGRGLHPDLWVNASFADFKKFKKEVDNSEEYEYPCWIFTDVRFPNEANAIVERGGIVLRVFRPGKLRVWFQDTKENRESDEHDFSGYYYVQSRESGNWELTEYADGRGISLSGYFDPKSFRFDDSDNHPSETALDDYVFDEVIINDGDIDSLKEKIKSILEKYKII